MGEKILLYTSKCGVELHSKGQNFHAWTEEEALEQSYDTSGDIKFLVDKKYILSQNYYISSKAELEIL